MQFVSRAQAVNCFTSCCVFCKNVDYPTWQLLNRPLDSHIMSSCVPVVCLSKYNTLSLQGPSSRSGTELAVFCPLALQPFLFFHCLSCLDFPLSTQNSHPIPSALHVGRVFKLDVSKPKLESSLFSPPFPPLFLFSSLKT